MTHISRPPFKLPSKEMHITGIVIDEPMIGEIPVGTYDAFSSNENIRVLHVDNLRAVGEKEGVSADFEMFPDELKTPKPWGVHSIGALSVHGEDKYREMFLQRPSKIERVKEMLNRANGGKTQVKFLPSVRELKR